MKKIILVTDNMLLGAMRRMLERGEISVQQYACSLRRAKNANHNL